MQAAPGADAVATVTVDPVERTTWRELAERSGRVVRLLAVEGARTPVRAWSAVLADLRAADLFEAWDADPTIRTRGLGGSCVGRMAARPVTLSSTVQIQ